jgi:predicted ribosomally synthesized peptide with nif11-like leader
VNKDTQEADFMSKGAKEFIDEVGRNAELRHKVFKQSSEVVLGLAKEHGYEFTKHELHDALREKLGVAHLLPADETESSNCVVVIVAASARNR